MNIMETLEKTLKLVCGRLNEAGINYYVVGAVGAYLDAGLPFAREHSDLDILIEEKEIEKLEKVFAGTDFEFFDKRMTSEKVLNRDGYADGEHEVVAKYKHGEFHVGFFLIRLDEDTYTMIDYFREHGVCKRLERTLPMEFFEAQYNETPVKYQGVKFKVVRKEVVYKNKMIMRREKDLFDLKQLEPRIEESKLAKLSGMHKFRKTVIVDL